MSKQKQSSISSFFNFSLKRKAEQAVNETITEKNRKYDKEKRERKFVPSWKELFPWVRYDETGGLMTCEICKNFASVSARNENNDVEFAVLKLKVDLS